MTKSDSQKQKFLLTYDSSWGRVLNGGGDRAAGSGDRKLRGTVSTIQEADSCELMMLKTLKARPSILHFLKVS